MEGATPPSSRLPPGPEAGTSEPWGGLAEDEPAITAFPWGTPPVAGFGENSPGDGIAGLTEPPAPNPVDGAEAVGAARSG